jgi:hypothetical protein
MKGALARVPCRPRRLMKGSGSPKILRSGPAFSLLVEQSSSPTATASESIGRRIASWEEQPTGFLLALHLLPLGPVDLFPSQAALRPTPSAITRATSSRPANSVQSLLGIMVRDRALPYWLRLLRTDSEPVV